MRRWISVFIMVVLLFIVYEILTESESILNSVNFSLNVFKNNVFPSLFPFFVLSNIANKGKFGAFAYYCWAAGAVTLVLTALQ